MPQEIRQGRPNELDSAPMVKNSKWRASEAPNVPHSAGFDTRTGLPKKRDRSRFRAVIVEVKIHSAGLILSPRFLDLILIQSDMRVLYARAFFAVDDFVDDDCLRGLPHGI